MKKTIEDYGKNLDRIKKELPAEREELSRERIELQDGKMCDLVAYDVKAYGYVENMPKTSSRAMETSVGLGL